MITHESVMRRNGFGGFTTTTLCGRMQTQDDGMNIGDKVTCKLCLKKLAKLSGDQFKMGVLLYDGKETLPLGNNIWAAPISTLWGKAQ